MTNSCLSTMRARNVHTTSHECPRVDLLLNLDPWTNGCIGFVKLIMHENVSSSFIGFLFMCNGFPRVVDSGGSIVVELGFRFFFLRFYCCEYFDFSNLDLKFDHSAGYLLVRYSSRSSSSSCGFMTL